MFSAGCYMIMLFLPSPSLTSQECCINSDGSEALHGRRGAPGLVENVVVTGGCIPPWAPRPGKKLLVSPCALLETTVHFS